MRTNAVGHFHPFKTDILELGIMKKSLGIYIHIPFCIKKCGYCDFCSFPSGNGEIIRSYTEELCRRIALANGKEYTVDTVYFGGGTPSLLPPACIEKIFGALHQSFDICDNAEITLECNPATADADYFRAVRSFGINRLSIGLQSASERELSLLGRVHGVSDFVQCFGDARSAGFDNISADLMYGIPEQTLKSLEYSVNFLTALQPEHISAYGLTVEEGTDFYRRRNELELADGDMQAEMYLLCSDLLSDAGYEKYEISNFARDKRISRHNMRYWTGEEYLGFGVAAHSYFNGERFGNSREIKAFIGGKDIVSERQAISEKERRLEYVMLRMRLTQGVDAAEYAEKFGRNFHTDFPSVRAYCAQGFMHTEGTKTAFTEKGFLVSNAILSDILDFD